MSIKENVDYVKEELNSQEKFLESFVKGERFYKKYRTLIFASIATEDFNQFKQVCPQKLNILSYLYK